MQNVDRIQTKGVEAAFSGTDVLAKGLDLNGSVTYADSVIKENDRLRRGAGRHDRQAPAEHPALARHALASYRFDERWTAQRRRALQRPQYRHSSNNADINGYTYQGVSKYFTADLRVRYRIDAPVVGARSASTT